ncbi:MAG TPA: UDP-N-acetylglucosamine--N-acetylmuramyl-(pentapeptide) pyrophosphoryl-undecaprenol N-acetylglucosamine transferase, partial [Nitrospirae bacterium]|nr:UDP-N-acetylglucosamine--N-acetylmuramyl-(pentapeptide) pyrophosphoryl-undecaprenol N-acetylglucosamine transferase [Nitrospirota bacterium]
LTGNPVRERILRGSKSSGLRLFSLGDGLFTIFIFGGSAGAESVNRAMIDALQYLLDLREEIQFLHQTGEKDFETVRDAYRSYGYTGMVTPFIYQMPEAYAVADLVVSRSGATTLAEICVTGKPSILVPYPYAAANHQEVNAGKLERLGAAVMVRNIELNGKRLSGEIRRLYNDPGLRGNMRTKAMGLGRPDAVKRIADIALSLISLERSREECLNSSE